MFDADGGGMMDSAELGKLLRVLGLNPSDQEVEALKREIDMDGDGEIEFEEFLLLMNSKLLRCSPATTSVLHSCSVGLQAAAGAGLQGGQDPRLLRQAGEQRGPHLKAGHHRPRHGNVGLNFEPKNLYLFTEEGSHEAEPAGGPGPGG